MTSQESLVGGGVMDEEEAMGRDWKESWLSTELAF